MLTTCNALCWGTAPCQRVSTMAVTVKVRRQLLLMMAETIAVEIQETHLNTSHLLS